MLGEIGKWGFIIHFTFESEVFHNKKLKDRQKEGRWEGRERRKGRREGKDSAQMSLWKPSLTPTLVRDGGNREAVFYSARATEPMRRQEGCLESSPKPQSPSGDHPHHGERAEQGA